MRDSQHFVVESSSTKEDSAITSDFSDPELKRVNTILSTYPNVNIVSNTRAGIYRLQIEIDMTKKEVTMITNIINPLLQAVSFISIWYLYQTMSKVKSHYEDTFTSYFLSYVVAASYFNLVKIVVDPLFFLVADLALVKSVLSIIDCFTLFIQLSF